MLYSVQTRLVAATALLCAGCVAPAQPKGDGGKIDGVIILKPIPQTGPSGPIGSAATALRSNQAQDSGAARDKTDPDAPQDPKPALDIVFQVEVYQLTVPRGSISDNSEFWAKLNEQAVDPATYDILQRNGLRVGEASFSDWPYFKALIDQNTGKLQQAMSVAREQKNMQLEMKKDILSQDIFHFDAKNTLSGRTYEKCDNLLSISFQPTPRRAGSMRLTVAPIVRGERKRLEFSVLNDERAEVQYINPEMLYDCNLRLDVPIESFIIIAPSPEARWPVSVGHAFLMTESKSELQEHVLIIVPRPFQAEGSR